MINYFKSIFKKDREREKEEIVSAIYHKMTSNEYDFNPLEQSEILNRLTIRVFERKKERRSQLIKEAREVQESMLEIKFKDFV